jgi:nucleoid-associated protein YgaU
MRASIARSVGDTRGVEGIDALLDAAAGLNIRNFAIQKRHGRTLITGVATYQLDCDELFDVVKQLDGWESDVVVDLDVERRDIRGYHTVRAGDTLASIAKRHLGRASREMDIFEVNRDRMNDPDQIFPGQQLLIPWR